MKFRCIWSGLVLASLLLSACQNPQPEPTMTAVGAGSRELSISTRKAESDDVIVAVRDSGPGLPAADFARIFEAFYTTKSSGLGMGLSICRSIVEAHGGHIWAESTGEGQGSTFSFSLKTSQ